MWRIALPLPVALLVALGCGDGAWASRTVISVDGEVRALAFSGDALVVVRVAAGRGLVLERLVAGSPVQTILATTLEKDSADYEAGVLLAASAQAVVLSLAPGFLEPGSSSVMVGAPGGPLREVAKCSTPGTVTLGTVAPVAVAGSRIAWREGGCGDARSNRGRGTPSAILIGDADPREPSRRIALRPNRLPVSLVLAPGDTGVAGIMLPPFGFDSELVPFSAAGPGAAITAKRETVLAPVGILGDGTRVVLLGPYEYERDCDSRKHVVTIAPGAMRLRAVPLGGCVNSAMGPVPPTGSGPVVAGNRILAFVGRSGASLVDTVSLVSVRSDGGDRRELVRGTYRRPYGVATDGARVAWWQPGCSGKGEIVIQEGRAARTMLASCRVEILTRSARLRAGRITVRVRCAAGCAGKIIGYPAGGVPLSDTSRTFSFSAGTHALRVPIALGRRRAGHSVRVRLSVPVEHGPGESMTINVRR